MEIKKGMYIRYAGNIDKVFGVVIDKNNSSLNRVYAENETVFFDKIEKASFNLIDLIKVGDYVNGEYVDLFSIDYYKNHSERLKSVLTKEQFEAYKYVVERDK